VKRFSHKTPGYDCIRAPCGERGCGTQPGSNHGIHNETWYYAVSDGTVALQLEVWSGIFPDTVPIDCRGHTRYPKGAWMDVHCAFPVGDEGRDEIIRLGIKGRECTYLDGGLCFGAGTWVTQGEELYERICPDLAPDGFTIGSPGFTKSESFWLGYESISVRPSATDRQQRAGA